MKVIKVGVYGGMVQWVENIPEGIEVQVFDYDTDGVDNDLLNCDADGHTCVVAIYAGTEEPEMLRRVSQLPLEKGAG